MSRVLLIVGVGGFLGSIARYLVALVFAKTLISPFPLGTFIVNVFGCFLIGLFYGLSENYGWFTPQWRLFLATGFCGGFTTFSSFAYENLQLLQKEEYWTFGAYSVLSFVLGLLGAFAGVFLIKTLNS